MECGGCKLMNTNNTAELLYYSTARFKLEGKLCVVIPALTMREFHSRLAVRVHAKLVAQKISVDTFCVSMCIPIEALCKCIHL